MCKGYDTWEETIRKHVEGDVGKMTGNTLGKWCCMPEKYTQGDCSYE